MNDKELVVRLNAQDKQTDSRFQSLSRRITSEMEAIQDQFDEAKKRSIKSESSRLDAQAVMVKLDSIIDGIILIRDKLNEKDKEEEDTWVLPSEDERMCPNCTSTSPQHLKCLHFDTGKRDTLCNMSICGGCKDDHALKFHQCKYAEGDNFKYFTKSDINPFAPNDRFDLAILEQKIADLKHKEGEIQKEIKSLGNAYNILHEEE